MKPKARMLLGLLCCCILALSGCKQSAFTGSRVNNEGYYALTYQVLNQQETCTFDLAAGDSLAFTVESEGGQVNLELRQGTEDPIYTGKDVPTSTFSVGIHASGTYTLTVTGQQAKGSVTVEAKQAAD